MCKSPLDWLTDQFRDDEDMYSCGQIDDSNNCDTDELCSEVVEVALPVSSLSCLLNSFSNFFK